MEGLRIHLVTFEEEEKTPDLIDKPDEIVEDLTGYGVEFDYRFSEFHDRLFHEKRDPQRS